MTTILFDSTSVRQCSRRFGSGLGESAEHRSRPPVPRDDHHGRSSIYWDNRVGEWVDPIDPADRAWKAADDARLEGEREAEEERQWYAWLNRQEELARAVARLERALDP